MSIRRTVAKVVGIGAVLLAGVVPVITISPSASAGPAPTATAGRSLRVLTYNTAFMWADLPGFCGSLDLNDGKFDDGASYPQRAADIAEAILATDNDVVVLQEVFSDSVKKLLVNELSSTYPTYIAEISKTQSLIISNLALDFATQGQTKICQDLGPTTKITSNDSGLMVFVKDGLEFVPFSSQANPPYDVADVVGRNQGAPWGSPGQIAVDTYDFDPTLGILEVGECYLEDCFSSKAAAMVRIHNPATTETYNIAFSHTQAWNDPPQVAAREAQFKVMKELIQSSLTPAEMTSQPVYVTGDLNTPGENEMTSTPGSEWTKLFNSANSSSGNFFACKDGPCTFSAANPTGSLLTDSWGFQTSPADDGVTNADDAARLDYFLHNQMLPGQSGRFCVQHVMRAYDLDEPVPLSDHVGLRVDLNRKEPHCSPDDEAGLAGPEPVALDADGNFTDVDQIGVPGGMHWYKLDKGTGWETGSYVFSIDPTTKDFEVDIDVYEGTDLSDPIPPFYQEPNGRWEQYAPPELPLYIRVFAKNPTTGAPDRTIKGGYQLKIDENRGLTPDDAIAMLAGDEKSYPWPGFPKNGYSAQQDNVTFLPDTKVWHTFFTDTATSGNFPEVTFLSENELNMNPGPDKPPFSMELHSADPGYPVLAGKLDQDESLPFANDYDDDDKLDYRLLAPELPGSGSGPQRYYLTVQRNEPAWYDDIHSFTTFRTTLTYIRSLQLKILEEVTWGPAADSSEFQWAYDSGGTDYCKTTLWLVCHGPKSLDDGYIVNPYLWDSSFNGSFTLKLAPKIWEDGDLLKMLGFGSIDPYPANLSGVMLDRFSWRSSFSGDDPDYWYRMTYCVGHEPKHVEDCKLTD